jgi:multimeric flavodoxin WrbA
MKKLLFIFAGILIFGCEPVNNVLGKTCKKCTTTVRITGQPSGTSTMELCDGKWKDVDGQVITSTTKVGNVTVTMTSTTVCK